MFSEMMCGLFLMGLGKALEPSKPKFTYHCETVEETKMRRANTCLDNGLRGFFKLGQIGFLAPSYFPYHQNPDAITHPDADGLNRFKAYKEYLAKLGMTHEEFIVFLTNWQVASDHWTVLKPDILELDGRYYVGAPVPKEGRVLYGGAKYALVPVRKTVNTEYLREETINMYGVDSIFGGKGRSAEEYFLHESYQDNYYIVDCGCSPEDLMQKFSIDLFNEFFPDF